MSIAKLKETVMGYSDNWDTTEIRKAVISVESEMENANEIIEWLLYGKTGLSSKAIVAAWVNKELNKPQIMNPDYPHDPSDFRRCTDMLLMLPFINQNVMAGSSKTWDNLLAKWVEMEKLDLHYRKTEARTGGELYDLMKKIINETI